MNALPSPAGVSLRPRRATDQEFLAALYASTRADELAGTQLSEAQKLAFCRFQFAAQTLHYERHFPDATVSVIERAGSPVGRLYVDRREDVIHIVDIALIPSARGQGIGRLLLAALLDEARRTRKRVALQVEQTNPALRLYRRMGFLETAARGPRLLLEWRPHQGPPQEKTAS